jgi:hypothetical protein
VVPNPPQVIIRSRRFTSSGHGVTVINVFEPAEWLRLPAVGHI